MELERAIVAQVVEINIDWPHGATVDGPGGSTARARPSATVAIGWKRPRTSLRTSGDEA